MLQKIVGTQLSTTLEHISRTNKSSNVRWSAIGAMTHEKCKDVIGGDTLALCYEGPFKWHVESTHEL